ncbi:MAG TPA: hypothetical protein VJN18_09835 [Polyangiaceae bacterium]|nr:hypothetical protein [Polyangiaceae bacterium]
MFFQPRAQLDESLHVARRAGAQGAGDFHGRAALSQRDGVGTALVRERLPCCTLRGVERRARGALASLCPELRFADTRARDQLH